MIYYITKGSASQNVCKIEDGKHYIISNNQLIPHPCSCCHGENAIYVFNPMISAVLTNILNILEKYKLSLPPKRIPEIKQHNETTDILIKFNTVTYINKVKQHNAHSIHISDNGISISTVNYIRQMKPSLMLNIPWLEYNNQIERYITSLLLIANLNKPPE